IIQRTTIRFSEGLNALTGETGAGKSILLDALGAVLGSRVSSDLVRTGAKLARVEAAFVIHGIASGALRTVLAELGIGVGPDETLILSREIQANGRSSARVNGRLATAGTLAQIGSLLVDIHGQSDHLAIRSTSEQRNLLDRFGGLDAERDALASTIREWRSIRRRIQDLSRNSREREQRFDLLRFQTDEINESGLSMGEDERLTAERDVLRNADRLRADALEALALLIDEDMAEGSTVTGLLRAATIRTSDIASLDGASVAISERANELLVLAEDLARELRGYAENIDSDESRLSEIDDRIDIIQTLKRKYGSTIEAILEFGEAAQRDLEALSSSEYDVSALEEREADLGRILAKSALGLSSRRIAAAGNLAAAIE
ncbi:MAG: AAA family ATPase, partial [Thermomicrobiales bacterium]